MDPPCKACKQFLVAWEAREEQSLHMTLAGPECCVGTREVERVLLWMEVDLPGDGHVGRRVGLPTHAGQMVMCGAGCQADCISEMGTGGQHHAGWWQQGVGKPCHHEAS